MLTPSLGFMLGMIGAARYDDPSGLSQSVSVVLAIIGVVLSLIIGPIVSFAMRNSSHTNYSLAGYIVPNVLTVLYLAYMNIVG